ncbi:MAG: ChbG/HpnK family deacetylase [Roseburia sp.]|nr:ChbG/HpnK family deacetylase [Roseburia sp.]
MENKVWYHADDYGVTVEQSKRILECYREGALNSISVLPNSDALGEALTLLDEADPDARIRRVLHLNFVEGKPLAGAEQVPLLADKDGYFDKSFPWFFVRNALKHGTARRRLMEQIKSEIAAQLRAVTRECDYRITAIDSHQHYHMLPIVMDSLMEVLAEAEFGDLDIRAIRVPVDPTAPLLHNAAWRRRVPLMNWVKWLILRIYTRRGRKRIQACGMAAPVFFGIFFTCEMRWEVVKALLPAYRDYADKRGAQLELMFHPGNLTAAYELLDARNKELENFYMSDNRYLEAQCLKQLGRGAGESAV